MRVGLIAIAVVFVLGCGGPEPPVAAALDPEIAALIHDLVDGTDRQKREAAQEKLPAFGAVVVKPLAAALDREDVDAGVGAWIADVLGDLGPLAEPAAPALMRRLMLGGECSATTSWALGQIGAPAVPFLAQALSSEHAKARVWATDALLDLGAVAAPAAEALLRALDDPDSDVRTYAPQAIPRFPSVQDRAVPKLLALTQDPEPEVRYAAVEALAEVRGGDPAVHARLRAMVLDPKEEEFNRQFVLQAIDAHVGRDPADLAFLRAVVALGDDAPGAVSQARAMLLDRGVDDAVLIESYGDFTERTPFDVILPRAKRLASAGSNGKAAALPRLVRLLDWAPAGEDRVTAAGILGGLGAVAAADAHVMQALRVHADPANDEAQVNAACRAALALLEKPR